MRNWWKETIVYQIYPKSFMDSNGDGIGDLRGILSRLDYLQELGVDVLWLCPIFPSPNEDNGYDISDYQAIMADFGTMDDFDALLADVHRRGMKLILDLVINHTSDEHPWFVESRSGKDSPKRDWYIWRPGKNGAEPNNWESIFGGSAWEYDEKTGEYYMHLFTRKQPDLNWENEEVRRELYRMINWWLDRGVDGFRVDAITHIKKKPGLPDLPNPDNLPYVPSYPYHMNVEGILDHLAELKRETFDRYDIMTVGEANGVSAEEAEAWVGEKDGVFNMIFQFETNGLWNFSAGGKPDWLAYKRAMTRWQVGLEGKGWNALYFENHDLPRSVSVWGDDGRYREKSAKALATLYFLMKGTPFIYQGQELGMTNVRFPSIEDYDDVPCIQKYWKDRGEGLRHEEAMAPIWRNGRDNARTPMQWNAGPQAGFTTGTPWLKVNPNHAKINVEEQLGRPDSVLRYYQKLIRLRKANPTLVYGRYALLLPDHEHVYAYTRTLEEETFLIAVNLSGEEQAAALPDELDMDAAELVLANEDESRVPPPAKDLVLRPYEARVYRLKK
jgi:alpha-glucosidase